MASKRNRPRPRVGIVMGSASDGPTMRAASTILDELGVDHEMRVLSAHRMPDDMFDYAATAADRGVHVIIAGAGGAAHLPGMIASKTHLPVLGVPVRSATSALNGVDALLSIVQMPGGIPVGTLAIGESGAKNAALLACSILALHDDALRAKLIAFRAKQTNEARASKPQTAHK
jgi:5-(carboxyamino)imidazole ribonucleotide mutase